MKYFGLLLLVMISFASCQKDKIQTFPAAPPEGSWLWEESSGGVIPISETPQSTGVTKQLQIRSDGTYREITNSGSHSGTYSITTQQSIFSGNNVPVIRFDNGIAQSWEINGDKLYLNDEVYDGRVNRYVKY